MIAITALQHISLGLLVLMLLPLASGRWLVSFGVGWVILFLAAAFGQVLLGIMKSGNLSAPEIGWTVGGVFMLFLAGTWWVLRKRSKRR